MKDWFSLPNLAKMALVVALSMNMFVVWHSFQSNQRFRPLLDQVPQAVSNPKVKLTDTVDVTAVKCNRSRSPVVDLGNSSFQSVDRPEAIFVRSAGSISVKQPGCVTQHFQNPIPLTVQDYVKSQGHPMKFKITGIEIPLRTKCDAGIGPSSSKDDLIAHCHGGSEGDPIAWYTDEFVIAP